jgi:bacteriocin biosynthesis cyclodehydratase domain-containing protein
MSEHSTRPVLAPGLRILRRSRHDIQIGLSPEHRVVLPDAEPVRRTLGHLLRGEAVPDGPDTEAVLATLAPVLVDGSGLVSPGLAAGDVAAVALRDHAGYPARIAARRGATVRIFGSLGDVEPGPLLAAAGLRTADDESATVALVLSAGEVDREVLDALVRARTPHLCVRLVEGTAVVGPFVDPGRTACLCCMDSHRTLDDPQAASLSARHAGAAADRRDGVAEPLDTALATLAVAWAVRDVVTHVEGDLPSTWSTTVELSATLASVTQTEWLRHPSCGCTRLPHDGTPPRAEAR